jgi:hypothetical protein
MTVSLALSDYQLEPALFLHYRSVGWMGMGPGVMVRPSMEAFTKHLQATGGVMLQVRLGGHWQDRIVPLCTSQLDDRLLMGVTALPGWEVLHTEYDHIASGVAGVPGDIDGVTEALDVFS